MSNLHHFKNSTSLAHCDFIEPDTLKIKFHSSEKEHKWEAPKSVYEALKAAESPGKHFHQHIRGKYAEK